MDPWSVDTSSRLPWTSRLTVPSWTRGEAKRQGIVLLVQTLVTLVVPCSGVTALATGVVSVTFGPVRNRQGPFGRTGGHHRSDQFGSVRICSAEQGAPPFASEPLRPIRTIRRHHRSDPFGPVRICPDPCVSGQTDSDSFGIGSGTFGIFRIRAGIGRLPWASRSTHP